MIRCAVVTKLYVRFQIMYVIIHGNFYYLIKAAPLTHALLVIIGLKILNACLAIHLANNAEVKALKIALPVIKPPF